MTTGLRRHLLLTKANRAALPALYAQEGLGEAAVAHVKLFSPYSDWTWYITEFDGEDTLFGLVFGMETEYGYFSLSELEAATTFGGKVPAVERDMYWEARTLDKVRAEHGR